MKRKIVLIALAGLMAISVVGCGSNKKTSMRKPDPIVSESSTKNVEFYYGSSDLGNKNNYSIDGYEGNVKNLIIPDADEYGNPIVEVSHDAFACSDVETITLGKNILSIGDSAFFYCKNLKKIDLNSKITTIDDSTFLNSSLNGKIVLPNSVKTIGDDSFAATNIEEIELGSGLKSIGGQAFQGCKNLKKVVFNSSNVEFYNELIFSDSPNVVIVAPKGSTAEQYAKDNNIKFEVKE